MQGNILQQAMIPGGVVKCEELWYEDGNLVIQIKNSLFKVHRSILCRDSSVFADMFTLPHPAQPENYFEGASVVELHDDVEEVTYLLQAIYKSSIFSELLTSATSKPTFEQVIAFARLGTKYDVPYIRRFALRLLRLNLPLSAEDFNLNPSEEHWIYKTKNPSITMFIKVIELARQLDLPDLLPAAFTVASCCHTRLLLKPDVGGLLTDEDKYACLEGHEQLLVLQSAITAYFAAAKCPQGSRKCADVIDFSLGVLLDQNSQYTPFFDYSLPNLCKACSGSLKEKVLENRQLFWNKIPAIFNLSSWEVLRARREEDEGVSVTTEATSATTPGAV